MLKDSSRKLVVEGGERVIHFNTKQFKPVPEEGIEMAVEAMRAGIMYRYQPKEAELSRTTELEERSPSTWASNTWSGRIHAAQPCTSP